MCVVPLGGLVWAAVGGGSGETTEATAETSETGAEAEGDETSTGTAAKPKKKKRKKRKKATPSAARGTRKVLHEAGACCEALRAAGRDASDVTQRPTFLAAASACEAAPTEARARTQVRSIVEGSKLDLPSECQTD